MADKKHLNHRENLAFADVLYHRKPIIATNGSAQVFHANRNPA